MPFKSKRQQRFMYATKPEGVDLEEWAEETDFDKLPEKVRKKKKSKKDKDDAEAVMVDFDFPAMDAVDKALAYAAEYERQVKLAEDRLGLGYEQQTQPKTNQIIL